MPSARHAAELRGVGHLAVLQRVAVVGARVRARARASMRVDRELGRLVAVGVDVQLEAGARGSARRRPSVCAGGMIQMPLGAPLK